MPPFPTSPRGQVAQPPGADPREAQRAGPVDPVRREARPGRREPLGRSREVLGGDGEPDGVDRAGRDAGEDVERLRARADDLRERADGAYLVCGPRAAAGQDESDVAHGINLAPLTRRGKLPRDDDDGTVAPLFPEDAAQPSEVTAARTALPGRR
jgi:hypothetical protein